MANRVTQIAVEALQSGGNPHARLTQVAVETLALVTTPPPTNARLTQIAVEALALVSPPPTHARLTQIAVEALTGPGSPHARLTQIAVETLATYVPPPALTVQPPTSATTGNTYSGSLAVSGGTPPYTYTITSGPLPPGLSLNPSTGVISGTPTTVGSYPYTVTVTDSHGATGSASYSITVSHPPPPPNPCNVEFILRRIYVYMRPHERLPVRGG